MKWLQRCPTAPLAAMLAIAFIVVAVAPASALTAQRTETFDTDLGNFTASDFTAQGVGNNFGWSNTANAGGPAGELGGTFARTPGSLNAYYADPNLGGTFTQAEDLIIRGTMTLTNINADGGIGVGYLDSSNNGKPFFLGLLIEEPNPGPAFRLGLYVNDQHAGQLSLGFQDQKIDFNIQWDGNPDGSGTLSGDIVVNDVNPFALDPTTVGPGTWNYDMFGVGAMLAGSNDPPRQAIAYFDNLTYNIIPEPTGVALFGLGIGMLLLRRKR